MKRTRQKLLWSSFVFALTCFMVSAELHAQITRVKGTVKDEAGEPLPGVAVKIKNSTEGTMTDVSGNFSMNATPDDILLFSYLGFTSQEIKVGNTETHNITLIAANQSLEEIVVVGYGTQRRADITGSVAIVNMEEAKKISTNDVGNMLAGRVAGVSVT